MKTISLSALTLLLAAGCATTSSSKAPTHRWASAEVVDEVQYRNDHARCQTQANISDSSQELDANSPAFAAYSQCMTSRGYELTAYRN